MPSVFEFVPHGRDSGQGCLRGLRTADTHRCPDVGEPGYSSQTRLRTQLPSTPLKTNPRMIPLLDLPVKKGLQLWVDNSLNNVNLRQHRKLLPYMSGIKLPYTTKSRSARGTVSGNASRVDPPTCSLPESSFVSPAVGRTTGPGRDKGDPSAPRTGCGRTTRLGWVETRGPFGSSHRAVGGR